MGVVTLGALLFGVYGKSTEPVILASTFFNSDSFVEIEYEWCCDSGTNRFVTNDMKDFLPQTVVWTQTRVAVGGGQIVSP